MTLYNSLMSFMAQGGPVLWAVAVTSLLLWLCIFERGFFYRFEYPKARSAKVQAWSRLPEHDSPLGRAIRQQFLCDLSLLLHARLKLINTLIMLCPLIGLTGTVTGMISLFDSIAINGNSEIKAISAGIYRAILPTLAGLVTGLSGYYFAMRFGQKAQLQELLLAEDLAASAQPEQQV